MEGASGDVDVKWMMMKENNNISLTPASLSSWCLRSYEAGGEFVFGYFPFLSFAHVFVCERNYFTPVRGCACQVFFSR